MKNTWNFLGIIAVIVIIAFTISTCDDGKTKDPCAKGHTPGAAATCETAQICTVCDYIIQNAKGHNFGNDSDWVKDAEPASCEASSHDTRNCKNAPCTVKDKRTGSHPALGHDLPGAKLATCVATGSTGTGHCTRCNENLTGEVIPINSEAHDFSGTPVITPAACEIAGKEVITCSNVGCNKEHETPIDALEHDWNWTANAITATCVLISKDTATCINTPCLKTNERDGSNPALGHDWNITSETLPTCIKAGSRSGNCKRCTETITNQILNATGHSYQKSICTVCYNIEMVQIPSGTFTMGPDFDNNNATFDVTLSAFKMSKYEVTQELYEAVTGNNPSIFHGRTTSREPAEGETQSKRPVERVSWFDAVEFCNKLSEREGFDPVYTIEGRMPETGYPITSATVTADWEKNGYRLPTDAQWEYACRAGSETDWHFGDTESDLEKYAWYDVNSSNKTHEVGKKLPNDFGLFDMHGNLFEWCWDWWANYPTEAQTDYKGTDTGVYHVFRGGSWNYLAALSRSAFRSRENPYSRRDDTGIRLVRP